MIFRFSISLHAPSKYPPPPFLPHSKFNFYALLLLLLVAGSNLRPIPPPHSLPTSPVSHPPKQFFLPFASNCFQWMGWRIASSVYTHGYTKMCYSLIILFKNICKLIKFLLFKNIKYRYIFKGKKPPRFSLKKENEISASIYELFFGIDLPILGSK